MKRIYPVILLLAILIAIALYNRWAASPPNGPATDGTAHSMALAGPPDIYPDRGRTPGAANPDITEDNYRETLCNPHWSTRSVRPPEHYTEKLKREQIDEYDSADPSLRDYEEDHLIPLELGGDPSSPQNLWPEPYRTSIPDGGAHAKDKVENYLREQVCAGAIPLRTAQQEIATDWYRVYQGLPDR